MQSETVRSCSHVRSCGRLEFEEEDEEDGSIEGEYGGGKQWSMILWPLGGKSIERSASEEERAGEEAPEARCWWSIGWWRWWRLKVKGGWGWWREP